ncbi:MAG: hypothetical protein P4L53_02350 [Candidatus Obscuribacterales bacterium]|nr:hypothetical protein [Candidatus Obscuribacterales bacterium]
MLKKINPSIITAAVTAALCQLQVVAQGTFQQPVVLFNNSQMSMPFGSSSGSSVFLTNPFTNPYSSGYGFGGGFAPGLVTGFSPYTMSPLGYGAGYSGFGRNWIGRAVGFGGFGNLGYPAAFGLGGYGGNPFTGAGGFGNFGYPGGFGGYGGYGNIGYPGGFGWGGYGGNPFTGSGGFSPFNSTSELGTLQGSSQVIQIGPSKSSGNYYQPSTVDTSASGSYYASITPPAQQAAPVSPRPSRSGWTSPSGNGDFWGSGGNGLPKDLNSVPWNK